MLKNELVHSSKILSNGKAVYGDENHPDFILDDTVKIKFLQNYAKNFRAAAEEAIKTGDRSKLPKEVQDRDANVFMQNGANNFKHEFTRLAAKYFTLQLHGEGPNPAQSLGEYDPNTRKTLNKIDKLKEGEYKAKVRYDISKDDGDFEKYQNRSGKTMDYIFDSGLSTLSSEKQGDEKMSEYGPGKKSPVCRHYAPNIAIMMHSAGVPGYLFSNNVLQSDIHDFYPHASFITADGTAVIEVSTEDANHAYRPVIAASKATGKTNAIDALKNNGEVMVITYNGTRDDYARVYTTNNLISASDVASSRYALALVEKGMNKRSWNATTDLAGKALNISRLEDINDYEFHIPEVKEFARKDTDIWPGKVDAKLPTTIEYSPSKFEIDLAK